MNIAHGVAVIDGKRYDVPRHVHRGGVSMIVFDESSLREALADGWYINPNDEVISIPVVDVDPVDTSAESVDPAVKAPAAARRGRLRKAAESGE